jgi:hypothetical protein
VQSWEKDKGGLLSTLPTYVCRVRPPQQCKDSDAPDGSAFLVHNKTRGSQVALCPATHRLLPRANCNLTLFSRSPGRQCARSPSRAEQRERSADLAAVNRMWHSTSVKICFNMAMVCRGSELSVDEVVAPDNGVPCRQMRGKASILHLAQERGYLWTHL